MEDESAFALQLAFALLCCVGGVGWKLWSSGSSALKGEHDDRGSTKKPGRSKPPHRDSWESLAPWYKVFGIYEPVYCVVMALFLSVSGDLYPRLLFSAAYGSETRDSVAVTVTALVRMHASAHLALGLCQGFLWAEWKRLCNWETGGQQSVASYALRSAEAWQFLMVVADAHHLFFALPTYLNSTWAWQFLEIGLVTHGAFHALVSLLRVLFLYERGMLNGKVEVMTQEIGDIVREERRSRSQAASGDGRKRDKLQKQT